MFSPVRPAQRYALASERSDRRTFEARGSFELDISSERVRPAVEPRDLNDLKKRKESEREIDGERERERRKKISGPSSCRGRTPSRLAQYPRSSAIHKRSETREDAAVFTPSPSTVPSFLAVRWKPWDAGPRNSGFFYGGALFISEHCESWLPD